MEAAWIKIALSVNETTQLTQINVNLDLENILEVICQENGLKYEKDKFALKARDQCNMGDTEYVTEENKRQLKHGRQLELSESPPNRIANLLKGLYEGQTSTNLRKLASESRDSVLLKEMHRQNVVQHLRVMVSVREFTLEDKFLQYKLMGRLLGRGYLRQFCPEEVEDLARVVISEEEASRPMLLLSLDLLALLRRRGKLQWPTEYLRKLTAYIKLQGEPKLQEKTLKLINLLYLYAEDQQERETITEFMSSSVLVMYIKKYVIQKTLSDGMKKQLYLYQKVILQKYRSRVRRRTISNSSGGEDPRRLLQDSFKSYKLDTQLSVESGGSSCSEEDFSGQLPVTSGVDLTSLTQDCLSYFAAQDNSAFKRVMLLHDNDFQSVLRLGTEIVELLCRIFEIQGESIRPGRFVPLCFFYHSRVIERMFCIAIRQFHGTRKEMKVAIDSDECQMVLEIVEEQLVKALEAEPVEFLEMEMRLNELTLDTVMRGREEIIRREVEHQLTQEPAFIHLKEMITPRIMDSIKEKRLRFMELGEHVPQYDYKGQKITGKKWYISVPKTRNRIVIEECLGECGFHRTLQTVHATDIREIESGIKSNFYKEVRFNLGLEKDAFFRPKQLEPDLEYPISIKLQTLNYVDFCAESKASMDYWVDGLNILAGFKMVSDITAQEFDYLLDIELMTHLAELEGIPLPKEPPLIPPPPPNFDFTA